MWISRKPSSLNISFFNKICLEFWVEFKNNMIYRVFHKKNFDNDIYLLHEWPCILVCHVKKCVTKNKNRRVRAFFRKIFPSIFIEFMRDFWSSLYIVYLSWKVSLLVAIFICTRFAINLKNFILLKRTEAYNINLKLTWTINLNGV